MPWTPLHASLGEQPGGLDFDLIEHAVRTHIAQLQDEHNNGHPWEHRHPGEVGPGRPIR